MTTEERETMKLELAEARDTIIKSAKVILEGQNWQLGIKDLVRQINLLIEFIRRDEKREEAEEDSSIFEDQGDARDSFEQASLDAIKPKE